MNLLFKNPIRAIYLPIISLFFIFNTQLAQADTYQGLLRNYAGRLVLAVEAKSQNSQKTRLFDLDFQNNTSELQIRRLSTGDFISISADISPMSPSLLNVSSVDYVGLAFLSGVWHSAQQLCFEFTDFTTFLVYPETFTGACRRPLSVNTLTGPSKFTFFINPDIYSWNLAISSVDQDYTGMLNIIDTTTIEIQLFSDDNGDILRTVILRR